MWTKKPEILLVLLVYQGVQVFSTYVDDVYQYRSNVLNQLQADYDRGIRPSNVTEVSVSFSLLSIKELDSEDQILSGAGFFTVVWNDSRLGWDTSGKIGYLDTVNFLAAELWKPELVILNSVDTISIVTDSNLQFTVISKDPGTVAWKPTIFFEVYCDMDLKFFPFDKHTCGVTLSTWTNTKTETPVQRLSSSVDLSHYKSNPDWYVADTSVEESETVSSIGSQSFTYSKVTFNFTLHRQTNYYGLHVILPLLLLSLLSTLVFVLPSEGGDKASYSMLVMVAFFILTGIILGYMPVSTKTTIIAVYMTLVLFIIASSTLCASIVINVHYTDPGQPMSAASRRVSKFLMLITCKNLMGSDNDKDILGEDLESSETTSTNLGNSLDKSNGSLRNRELWQTHAYPTRPLPPVDTIYKRNQIRPKSESSVKTMRTDALSVRELNAQTLKELADSLDRFFFIMFLVISVLVNFIMLVVLAVGQSS